MIWGRNAGLWTGLVQAGLNLVAAAWVVLAGHDLTAAGAGLFAAANAFGAVLVALVANSSDTAALPTFAPTTRERRIPPAATATVTSPAAPDQQRRATDQVADDG